jgi:hypothetical protein
LHPRDRASNEILRVSVAPLATERKCWEIPTP